MTENIVMTLDNNPALEAKIARLEDEVRSLQSERAMWKQRCDAYRILLQQLYDRS